jgi:hypothetical protein
MKFINTQGVVEVRLIIATKKIIKHDLVYIFSSFTPILLV